VTFEATFAVLTADDIGACDLLTFAGGRGHREYPCLSRSHNPASCIPCLDFSPWLRERIRREDVEGLGEYLWRVRRANPGMGGSNDQVQHRYCELARAVMAAPIERHLARGSEEAYLDLRVALIMLAAHESFSGFIMASEAADFASAAMAPYSFSLAEGVELLQRRNAFVTEMARGMDYWACWTPLAFDAIRSPIPPHDSKFQILLAALARLPLGARAHAVDALRHLSADPRAPRSLASLCRHDTGRHGIDVAESSQLILDTGLVVPASDMGAWLAGGTRRDLLGFLAQAGYRAPRSWSKEKLTEVALTERADDVQGWMAKSGAIELAPDHAEAAHRLRGYLEDVKETWRVWLGFGTGVTMDS
jgi:hypothetical protein